MPSGPSTANRRRGPGNPLWQKGKSANPGGRKSQIVDGVHVPTLARQFGPEAIKVLAEIMQDREMPPAPRVRAAEVLLERGFGKPQAVVEIKTHQRDPSEYTDDELAAALDGDATGSDQGEESHEE
jgi:hypothetical protein